VTALLRERQVTNVGSAAKDKRLMKRNMLNEEKRTKLARDSLEPTLLF
jgi:hypothetical protein